MITQVELPTKEQLKTLVDEALATADDDKDAFILKNLHGIKIMLDANPKAYEHYGAYWWSVKQLLIEHAFIDGVEDEPITREHFSYDDPAYTLCAAWAYHQHQIESMVIVPSLHAYDADGEPYEYTLEDTEMLARMMKTQR